MEPYTNNFYRIQTFVLKYFALHRIKFISICFVCLTLNLLTTTIVAPASNASKWHMGFNSAFKGVKQAVSFFLISFKTLYFIIPGQLSSS
jgi:hypothetical protein